MTRAFASGGPSKNSRPADQYVNPSGTAYSHDALKAFLQLETPSNDEVHVAREQIEKAAAQLRPDMLGPEATVLSLAASKIADPVLVLELYRAMRKAGVQPPPLVLEVSAKFAATTTDDPDAWKTALDIVDEMHDAVHLMPPSADIFELAISTCAQAGKWIVGLRLLEEMGRYGLVPSPDAFVVVGRSCLVAGEHTAMTKLLAAARALDDGDYDVEDVLRRLLDAAIDTHDPQTAHQLLLALHDYTQPNINIRAVQSFWRSLVAPPAFKEPPAALDLSPARRMAYVAAFAAGQQWIPLHQWLPVLGFDDYVRAPHPHATHQQYMKLAFAIVAFLRAAGEPIGPVLHDALLQGCGRHGLLADARQLLAAHPAPTMSSFYFGLTACQADAEAAESLFADYSRLAPLPVGSHPAHGHAHVDVCNALLVNLVKAGRHRDVVRFATSLPTETLHNARTMGSVMAAARALGDWPTVVDIFKQARVQGVECSPFMFADALVAYASDGQGATSLRLYQHIAHEDPSMSLHPVVVNAFFLCCLRSPTDALPAAMEAFRRMERDTDAGKTRLLYTGALDLLELIGRADSAAHSPEEKLACLHDVWEAVVRNPDVYTASDKQVPPHLLNRALFVAVNAHAVDVAEALVIDAEDMGATPNAVTCQLMMRLYSDATDLRPAELAKNPPEHPGRFEYWWDQFQELGEAPTTATIEPLLLSILRGMPLRPPVAVTDVVGLIEAYGVPMRARTVEILFRIYELDGEKNWPAAQDLMNTMHDVLLKHTVRSMEPFARCALASLPMRADRLNKLLSFIDAQDDEEYKFTLWHGLALGVDDVDTMLEVWQAYLDRTGETMPAGHGIRASLAEDSAEGLRRIWQWLHQHGGTTSVSLHVNDMNNVRKRLEDWGEDIQDPFWNELLAHVREHDNQKE
ncbi:hypothetical protein ACHHYP_00519 [Achlya hypogyna]|uniref:Pentacotripeptide-repeat region of PRORP domain-containing protein n=1 Tax=Achlya hypogyna TaxID=1202772 RepID=A0A1V9ZUG6_ACHHY|nr:hypothetical protein ACHHYP_00519 [Achlya hypogyna]